MNALIPAADALPAAPWIFQALQTLVFPIHLIFMNTLLGCAGVAVYAGLLRSDDSHRRLAHALARALPVLVAMTVNFGVAALLFVQLLWGQFLYTSSILLGIFWLGVIPLVIIAYYLIYLYDFRFDRLGTWGQAVILPALLIFLVVSFIFTNNMTLMLRPETWSVYFANPAGTGLNLADPTLIPRYLHFIFGGLAVGGLFVALYSRYHGRRDQRLGEVGMRIGMGLFAWLTLLQMADGMVFLALLPDPVQQAFLGGSWHATGLFLLAFVLGLVALAAGLRRRPVVAAVVVVPLVYLMAEVRALVRSTDLRPHFTLAELTVEPQLSPLIMFLGVLLAGIAVIAWMLWRCARALHSGE